MRCVVDASFIAALFLPDEASDRVEAQAAKLDKDGAAAPALLQLEVINILLMAARRKRITGADLAQLAAAFDAFPVAFQPPLTARQRAEVLRLAQQHQLSAYDAAYLELAMRLNLPLASLDQPLLKAAQAEGVNASV